MKKHLFSMLLIPILGFGQLLEEQFESGIPATWTVQQTNANETWGIQPGGTGFTGNVAAVDYDAALGLQNELLITPTLNLTTSENTRLRFKMGMSYYWGVDPEDNYDFIVKISPDNGTTWTDIWDESELGVFTNWAANAVTIDISDYDGEANVKIAFAYVGSDGAAVYLDDVIVDSDDGSVEYCGPLAFTSTVEPISKVIVSNISQESSAVVGGTTPSHEFFLDVVGEMIPGETYPIALEGNTNGNFTNRFVVFIDWNQNGILNDAGEVYEIGTIVNSNGTDGQQATGNIVVPEDAVPGNTRMRVKKIFGTTNFLNPCLGAGFGQAEDYTINVEGEEEPVEGCLDTPNGSWGSLTPACSGAPELVTSAGWTGEYSNITVSAGTEYIFSSSITTDFITIANPDGTIAYAAGTGSVTWTAVNSETVRFILHNNADCEFENVSRSRFVQCGEILPPPVNDDCEDAIAVSCGDTVTGATTFATNSGGNAAGDVFYKFTGTGSAQMVTLSLCNSTYDTAIRVFTDCGLGTEVAYNDDSCGVQSEVNFMSDGTSTYYIMVEGWSSSTGNYELNITCSDPPVYDPCAPVHEGVATNGVGFVNNGTDNYMAANDFNVLMNTQFEVEKFTINVVTLGGEPTTFDLKFFEGETGVETQFGETLTGMTPTSITENGTFGSTGYPVYAVDITLPTSITFPATVTDDKKYWVGISGMPTAAGNPVYWVSSDYVYTTTLPTWQSADGGSTWAVFVAQSGANVEGDMIIEGECATLGLNDLSGAKFSYYPNPVNDVLNINTAKGIEKVEVFNLAGQSVMSNGKVMNGQVNVSALTSGSYVFRVTLEGGQVETFKVIKK